MSLVGFVVVVVVGGERLGIRVPTSKSWVSVEFEHRLQCHVLIMPAQPYFDFDNLECKNLDIAEKGDSRAL